MPKPPITRAHLSILMLTSSSLLLLLLVSTPGAGALESMPILDPRLINKKSCRQRLLGAPGNSSSSSSACACVSRVRAIIASDCCCIGRAGGAELPRELPLHLRSLLLFNISIERISASAFEKYPNLEEIELLHMPSLTSFDADALTPLPLLRRLRITDCRQLIEMPGVLFTNNFKIQSLELRRTGLTSLPEMRMTEKHKHEMDIVISENYGISTVPSGRIQGLRARLLHLAKNRLIAVEADAFVNCSIHNLELHNNPTLVRLSPFAFRDIEVLNNLDLSRTSLAELPSLGMNKVRLLRVQDVETLKRLPPVLAFSSLTTAVFTYPHHCCLFKHVSKKEIAVAGSRVCRKRAEEKEKAESVEEGEGKRRSRSSRRKREAGNDQLQQSNDEWAASSAGNWSLFFAAFFPPDDFFSNFSLADYDDDESPPFSDDELGVARCEVEEREIRDHLERVQCSPEPDAFNPCENIVGYVPLRYAIWFIWTLSVVFNAAVWVLLAMAYEARLRSHYLFMFNLSFANALSAIYLGFLAVEDQRTADEYFRFAVDWQTGIGCAAAGFLCVFSSILSILSMFFIAFEITYTTTQSVYGRKISFSFCVGCSVFSYLFSALMAALPLVGVSSYAKTATCLPLFIDDTIDRIYIVVVLLLVVLASAGMAACYGLIFRVLLDPKTPNRPEDTHIIMKFLLMIVTDLICWMPSAFLGVVAALGYPLISISVAKILIVCFFPLNTFTNPFLYVFLTKVIQRKVKKRALPVIRRLAHTPSNTLHSLSNLYQANAPGDGGGGGCNGGNMAKRRGRDAVIDSGDEAQYALLQSSPTQYTRTTYVSDTPRGSSSASEREAESLLANGRPRLYISRVTFVPTPCAYSTIPAAASASRRPLPPFMTTVPVPSSASSQASSSQQQQATGRRRSLGILKKVSALPEVSDLSEHSSESHHEHVISAPAPQRAYCELVRPHRCRLERRPASSILDSGRGSLASISTRDTHSVHVMLPTGDDDVSEDEAVSGGAISGASSTVALLASRQETSTEEASEERGGGIVRSSNKRHHYADDEGPPFTSLPPRLYGPGPGPGPRRLHNVAQHAHAAYARQPTTGERPRLFTL